MVIKLRENKRRKGEKRGDFFFLFFLIATIFKTLFLFFSFYLLAPYFCSPEFDIQYSYSSVRYSVGVVTQLVE